MEALVRVPRVVIAIVYKCTIHCHASFRFVCVIITCRKMIVKEKFRISSSLREGTGILPSNKSNMDIFAQIMVVLLLPMLQEIILATVQSRQKPIVNHR